MGNNRRTNRQQIRLYENLKELPQYNWEELNKSGNLRYLIKKKKDFDSKKVNNTMMEKLYLQLMDDYFMLVGEDPDRDELMLFKQMLIQARCLYLQGDTMQLNWIKIYEGKIQGILNRSKGFDPEENWIQASKWLGNGLIDKKKTSVFEYHHIIKTIINENERANSAKPKGNG